MTDNDYPSSTSGDGAPNWEREALREVALEGIRERRRARRWGIFFKSLLALYLFALLGLALSPGMMTGNGASGAHTAVVDMNGIITSDAPANAQTVINGLERAFNAEDVEGVMLRINSPGGSPVQSGRINGAMERLRAAHPDIPLYAVAGDVCASGAYYVAAAAERIYADKASIVGSIGVLMGSFGFTDVMDQVGIERRLYTAGENKAMLDPFSETRERNVEHVKSMLDGVHQQFIEEVREGRGDRLSGDEDKLFSGLYWHGERSVELGLVDELASPSEVAEEVIGAKEMVNYTPQQSLLDRLANQAGATAARVFQEEVVAQPGSMR